MTKTHTLEEATNKSIEYFNGDSLAAEVFVSKYALKNEKMEIVELTPEFMHRRLAKEFARIEKKYANPLSEEEIFFLFDRFKYLVPQGSPMFGIGNIYQRVSISNCFAIDTVDSYGGICRTDERIAQISKRRGGVGIDISPLRPKGQPTKNSALTTDGIVVFMDRFSNTSREVAQCIASGQRVLTETGLKKIEDILPNKDRVWTRVGWVKVINVLENTKTVHRVTSQAGYEIDTSLDHIFKTWDESGMSERKLSEIEEGDGVVLLCGTTTTLDNKPNIMLHQYEYKNSNNKPNNCILPLELNENLAYFLGYSYGDGSVERNKYGEPRTISLACGHKYPEIQSKLFNIIKSEFEYVPTIKPGDGALNKVEIYNKCIVDFLSINGLLKEKSGLIVFPEKILGSNNKIIYSFISGYFDADGYASGRKKGYSFSSINIKFLKLLQSILMSSGILSKIHFEDRSNLGWNTLYTLSIVGAYSKNIFSRLATESIKAQISKMLNGDGKRDNWLTPYKSSELGVSHNEFKFIPDDTQNISVFSYSKLVSDCSHIPSGILVKDTVISIIEIGECKTYDLQLEEENLFWCEGFYVHNSGRRGALMISISVHHPEVMAFIKAKVDLKKVTGANISVRVTDEFMDAVKKEKLYEQRWPVDSDKPIISQKVKAKEVWDEIVKCAHRTGEPGVLFWDTIINNSPSDSYADVGWRTVTTNPSLRGDTKVLTDKGIYPIKWISENIPSCKVVNIMGEWKECSVFKSGTNKQLVKIVFSNNQEVFCTPEHKWPILTKRGGICNTQTGFVNKKTSLELKRQDKIYFPSFDGIIGNNLNCRFNNDDGFVLGWNQGDGWITTHIACNNVDQYGFIFNKADVENGIANRILDYTNNIAKKPSELHKDHNTNSYSYTTTDLNVRKRMAKFGSCRKEEGVPSSIWEGNEEFIKGYIDGIFSSDAYVGYKNRISHCRIILVSSHEKLVKDIQKLLSFFGIKSRIVKSQSTSVFPNYNSDKIYTRYDLNIDGIHAAKFASLFKLSSVDKQNKLDKILKLNIGVGKNNTRLEYANQRNYLVVKSAEITDFKEDVYDITVNDATHTFLMETGITGNCGELPLAGNGGSCILLLQNLSSYVDNPFSEKAKLNKELLIKHTKIAQRLIDDMVDLEIEAVTKIIEKIEHDPEPDYIKANELSLWKQVRETCQQGRRTGLGITGLGDCIAMLNVRYGSEDSVKLVKEIFTILRDETYRSSIELAKERGAFPIWDSKKETDNKFINRLPEDILKDMRKYGRRNIACQTISPAGSVSTLTQTTSGFEPAFQVEYTRKRKLTDNDKDKADFTDATGDKWKEYKVTHRGLKLFKEVNPGKEFKDSPYFKAQADDIDHEMRIKMQAMAQKYICHAISSTVNLPNNTTIKTIEKLYMMAWEEGTKGLTIYRDGSRDGVLTKDSSGRSCEDCDDASNKLKEMILMGKRPTKIMLSTAPKRPTVVECEIHRSKVGGGDWLFFVGMHSSQPYEVFGGDAEEFTIPHKYKSGWICKNGKNKEGITQYNLVLGSLEDPNEKLEFKGITKHFNNQEYGSFTRTISLSLRHGIPIKYICEQLIKSGCEGELFSFQRAMSRILKKYIADGEQAGIECPMCHSTKVYYKNGCPACKICGHSNCM